MSEPCSSLLWWYGRWSGPVLGTLERRADHAGSCATWELLWWQAYLLLLEACWSLYVDRVKSRGSVGAEAEPSWGA